MAEPEGEGAGRFGAAIGLKAPMAWLEVEFISCLATTALVWHEGMALPMASATLPKMPLVEPMVLATELE